MSLLIAASVAMLLLAAVIIVMPFVLVRNRAKADALTNTQLVRQRMTELEREYEEGLLSAEDKQAAIRELKIALATEATDEQRKSQGVGIVAAIAGVVLVIVASTVYVTSNQMAKISHWQESYERLPELSKRVVMEADQSITPQDLQDFALGLRTKLALDGDDVTGWLLLGRLHMSMGQLESALHAFEKSHDMQPQNTSVLDSYSQALMAATQQSGDDSYIQQAKPLLETLVALEPENINARGMLAVVAGLLGDKQTSLANWRYLASVVPEESPMATQINMQIAKLTGEEASQPALASAEKSATRIDISVTIDSALKAKLPKQAYLFVFAQDADGTSRMPAAVVRQPLDQFPVSVTLSDENAMMPGFTLSQLSKARLVARVSVDENVATAEGEFQGEVLVELKPGEALTETILINKELL